MPHIIIEVSANLRERVDLQAFVDRVHAAALETGVFPIGGARTRVAERAFYKIADGDPENAFVHVVLRVGHGRDMETKKRVGETVFRTVCDALRPTFERTPLGISLEVEEIDPNLSWRENNLHDYVARRTPP